MLHLHVGGATDDRPKLLKLPSSGACWHLMLVFGNHWLWRCRDGRLPKESREVLWLITKSVAGLTSTAWLDGVSTKLLSEMVRQQVVGDLRWCSCCRVLWSQSATRSTTVTLSGEASAHKRCSQAVGSRRGPSMCWRLGDVGRTVLSTLSLRVQRLTRRSPTEMQDQTRAKSRIYRSDV